MRPEDLFFLQIQGSGVLTFDDGRRQKAVYAAKSDDEAKTTGSENALVRFIHSLKSAAGEEVTIDYALQTAVPDWEMACHCRSPYCRKRIRGDDWMRPDLQELYRGHFSPFLNRRIEAMDAEE